MKFAFINDDVVKKIEDFESEDQILDGHLYQAVINITDYSYMPKIGWSYKKGILFLYCAPVTARQIRRGLLASGVFEADIEAALNSLPEPTRSVSLIEWRQSNEFFRDNSLVPMVAVMLGWNAEQLDNLWILSSKL
ncbi:MAG: hypothetical protein BWY19_00807 [bacterium ADurb.Bin212]|nr:MAG: hypothetical protein BWY19_00807 [bacterium ADurb.Bin212]